MRSAVLLATLIWVVVASATVDAAQGKDTATDGYNVRVEFVGVSSSKIKLYPRADANKFIRISMKKVVERTVAGAPTGCQLPNFDSTDVAWSDPTAANITSPWTGSATLVAYTSTFTTPQQCGSVSNVSFSLKAYLYKTSGFAWNGNDSVLMERDQLKFSIDIGTWPWKNADGQLSFGVRLETNKADSVAGQTADPTRRRTRFSFSGFLFDAEARANIDGVMTNITVNQTTGAAGQGYVDLDFIFPHYATSIDYDPVMMEDTSGDTSTSAGQQLRVSVAMASVAVMLLFVSAASLLSTKK